MRRPASLCQAGVVKERRSDSNTEAETVDVPIDALSPEALRGVVEEFVTRDGTDYGISELALEAKVADVLRQLRRGEARLLFDPASNTANIIVARQDESQRRR